jgi:hypothetical protein
MQHSLIARQLQKTIRKQAEAIIGDDPDDPNAQMIQATLNDSPLRTLMLFGGDSFNRDMAGGLLLMINRKFFKGLKLLMQSRKKNPN